MSDAHRSTEPGDAAFKTRVRVMHVQTIPADEAFGLPAAERVHLRVCSQSDNAGDAAGGELELLIKDPTWFARFRNFDEWELLLSRIGPCLQVKACA